jgi:hypothetical protein
MDSISIVSLTPDFSRAFRAARVSKPFQWFFGASVQAVETAWASLGIRHTWLKPGVNEIARGDVSHLL